MTRRLTGGVAGLARRVSADSGNQVLASVSMPSAATLFVCLVIRASVRNSTASPMIVSAGPREPGGGALQAQAQPLFEAVHLLFLVDFRHLL